MTKEEMVNDLLKAGSMIRSVIYEMKKRKINIADLQIADVLLKDTINGVKTIHLEKRKCQKKNRRLKPQTNQTY